KGLSSSIGSSRANNETVNGTSGRSVVEIDDEDAICRRTRARHSLANYTLEELETFLQESDDDVDPPNVDDEEEYRKFLAAVLVEGSDHEKEGQGDETVDEDEDNDADFELEIEEALESDVDENVDYDEGKNGKQEGGGYVPVTRQKKRLKESAKDKKTLMGQAKMPLRPLVPYESTVQASGLPLHGWPFSSPMVFPHCTPYTSGAYINTGFTANQLGQLYCLIHEHVQFLVQIFSLSVLDPSKQQVASEMQKLMSEMISIRENALDQRKLPYPEFCFYPPNLHSSVSDSHQDANSSCWTPVIDSHVMSILDVAPLCLVKSFMTDVSDSVWRHRQSHVEDISNKSHSMRVPLFPVPALESSSNTDNDISGGTATMSSKTHSTFPVLADQTHSKKSMASMLVESTKRETVALVPKDIAKAAWRFYPLFNAALFPHKPPAQAVVNRVLFTDSEDGLLAMGILQYNNDWAAIQQRFLPCKSTHQIFVRQKNRSSSKAPENPIKAVRRMKTSPLTTDERARISEGLKLFKNDWLSVWKFVVPYRDPSLLPRLWRIATGTQKSYRKSEAMKEKRRLYEAKRRKMKASMTDCHTSSDKEVDNGGDNSAGDVDGEDEAYVHEAFLADSEAGSSKHKSCDTPLLSISRSNMQSVNITAFNGTYVHETSTSIPNGSREPHQGGRHGFHTSCTQDLCPPSHFSHASHGASSKQFLYNSMPRASNSQLVSQACQTHKTKSTRVVKLAPDLPPVNLPPTVRVISQSTFKNYRYESSASIVRDNAVRNHVRRVSQSARVGSSISNLGDYLNKISDNGLDTNPQQDGITHMGQFGAEENTSESDLQMHPLLFQAPEGQLSSYPSINSHATGSTTHSSFLRSSLPNDPSPSRPQCSASSGLFSNATIQPKKLPLDLHTIDFHPFLQRADSENGDSSARPLLHRVSSDLEVSQGDFDKLRNQSDCMLRIPVSGNNKVGTSTASLTNNENESNLDLDIRLCSVPEKEKTFGRDCQNIEETPKLLGDDSFLTCSGRCTEVSGNRDLTLQVVPPNSNGVCLGGGDPHDYSIAGIVMEQEELSDSEEEIEHVEFEQEEIDDSEDDMDHQLLTGTENKEFPFFTSKEEEIQANKSHQPTYLNNGPVGKSGQLKRGRSSKKQSSDISKMNPASSRKPRKRPSS
ncbi:uncharacterized protein LOC109835145, partial [Asparagus officinalis]